MEEKRSFGEYLRKKRLELAMTQKDLAQRLYVTESTVSKWERGLSYPDVSLVTAICAFQSMNFLPPAMTTRPMPRRKRPGDGKIQCWASGAFLPEATR